MSTIIMLQEALKWFINNDINNDFSNYSTKQN